MLVLHEVIETRHYTAHLYELIFALAQATELQHLFQHKGVSCRSRIHSQSFTLQGGKGCDLRYGDQTQESIVAAHDDHKVRRDADRRLALALVIGDDVVDAG